MDRRLRGDKNWKWKGGRYRSNGYIQIRTDDGKVRYEHRILMELHIGRKLLSSEVVHHRNDVRDDNRIENLQLMTRAEHSLYHLENGVAEAIRIGRALPRKKPKQKPTQEEKDKISADLKKARDQRARDYKEKNKERLKARELELRKLDTEKRNALNRVWRMNNLEKSRASVLKSKRNNPEPHRKTNREYMRRKRLKEIEAEEALKISDPEAFHDAKKAKQLRHNERRRAARQRAKALKEVQSF